LCIECEAENIAEELLNITEIFKTNRHRFAIFTD